MPATPLSPAAGAVLEQALRLPPEERAALRRRLEAAAPGVDAEDAETGDLLPGPHPTASMEDAVVGPNGERVPSPAFLAQLEREADDVIAGRAPSYTWAEVRDRAQAMLDGPEEALPFEVRAALEAGREAARRAGEEPGA